MSQHQYGTSQNSQQTETLHIKPDANVLCTISKAGIANITLNRTSKHNAFDADMINTLLGFLSQLKQRHIIRGLILSANGKHFSAGADLQWMKSMASKTVDENKSDALKLAELLFKLDNFPAPTIAHVHGSAFGGALGLICCCDIAISDSEALFCLSEVKLGLIPATIGPYMCRTIGQRQARRYMLTAECFDADTAHQLGIIHKMTNTPKEARELLSQLTNQLLNNSPAALAQAKKLCQLCDSHNIDSELKKKTSALIADIRVSPEGQEGLEAFFTKRPPAWSIKNE